MNKNVDNVTPPATPPQPDSPGPAADLGRLSLDQHNRDNRGQTQRGRGPAGHSSTTKRAASSELPRLEKSTSPQQNIRNPNQYGPNGAKGPIRQRQRPGPKPSAYRGTSAGQRGSLPDFATPFAFGPKSGPMARDSGYGTMDSRRNTSIEPDIPQGAGPQPYDKARWLPSLTEEPKGVVTRLAGPVPVLIDSRYPKLIMQPESSPISQDQLAAEVKGIYGGLVMVEAKCKQTNGHRSQLSYMSIT